mgnify:CR=1 FL=1
MLNISITAETVGWLWGIPISNGLLTTWLAMATLILLSVLATRRLTLVPGRLQLTAELVVGGLSSVFTSVMHEHTKRFFGLLATLFLFILALNWSGLIPGVGTIGFTHLKDGHEIFAPLFRAGTADLNTTLALALIVVLIIQYAGFQTLGLSYLKKFINLSGPINFFVGILELVSEVSKVISFAFRLFGNIFAGEVLLTVVAFLIPLFVPIPFLGLELFVGIIQALVFSMLTAVFLLLATTGHEGQGAH